MAGGARPPGARAAALQESPIHKANTCSPPPASPHPRAAWGGCVWQPSRCPRRVLAAPGLSSPTTRLGRTEETKRLVARYVNQTSPFGARLSDILCLESFCGEIDLGSDCRTVLRGLFPSDWPFSGRCLRFHGGREWVGRERARSALAGGAGRRANSPRSLHPNPELLLSTMILPAKPSDRPPTASRARRALIR